MNHFIPKGSDREPLLPYTAAALLRPAAPASSPSPLRRLEDRQFQAMNRAYARSGGLASGNEIERRLRRRIEQPLSTIARWIVERRIVSFEWHSQLMIPYFQFDLNDMTIRSEVANVVNELKHVFDSWELAVWFAEPNPWLDGANPVDAIRLSPIDVFQAARADRFVALG